MFGSKIGWVENFGEKMGLCVVWFGGGGGGENKLLSGAQTFSTQVHTKLLSPKWREKIDENVEEYGKTETS